MYTGIDTSGDINSYPEMTTPMSPCIQGLIPQLTSAVTPCFFHPLMKDKQAAIEINVS
jgi:hypothetical protein